jgi:hypothetical protein
MADMYTEIIGTKDDIDTMLSDRFTDMESLIEEQLTALGAALGSIDTAIQGVETALTTTDGAREFLYEPTEVLSDDLDNLDVPEDPLLDTDAITTEIVPVTLDLSSDLSSITTGMPATLSLDTGDLTSIAKPGTVNITANVASIVKPTPEAIDRSVLSIATPTPTPIDASVLVITKPTPIAIDSDALAGVVAPTAAVFDLSFLSEAVPTFTTSPDIECIFPTIGALKALPTYGNLETEIDAVREQFITKISEIMTAGATGLDPTVEAAIWARARSRQDVENVRQYTEAETFFANRGYVLPPGALAARLNEINIEIVRNNSYLNNDITVEQARLAQANLQFAIEKGAGIVVEMMKTSASMVIEYNKSIIDAFIGAVEIYKQEFAGRIVALETNFKQYATALEAYKAKIVGAATLIDAQVKVYAADADRYKAEVAGISAIIDAQAKAYVAEYDGYKAEVGGAATLVDAQGKVATSEWEGFRAQIAGASAVVSAQASGFSAEMDGYKAEVGGVATEADAQARVYTAEVEGYKAAVGGAATVIDAEAKAYLAEMDAYKSTVDVRGAVIDAKVKVKLQEWEGYKNKLSALVTKLTAEMDLYKSQLEAYRLKSTNYIAVIEAQLRRNSGLLEFEKIKADWNMKLADNGMENARRSWTEIMETNKATAQIRAQIVASALASINTGVNYGFSGQLGASSSQSHEITESTQVITQMTA